MYICNGVRVRTYMLVYVQMYVGMCMYMYMYIVFLRHVRIC